MSKLSRRQLAELLLEKHDARTIKRVAAHLVETGRSKEIELLLKDVAFLASRDGHVAAEVKSATKLEAGLRKHITNMVSKQTNAKSVELIEEVDPSLVGGVVVTTPETEVDVSIRGRLNRMKV